MAQRSIDDLRQKYDAEMKRAEDEFNSKYEEFLDVQKDLVPAILRKRQAELQEMMQKNINFKNESQRLLKQAEADAFAPVRLRATPSSSTPTATPARTSTPKWAKTLQSLSKRR